MFQIRIHGRGGQGVVSGAEMLSVAAFMEGRYAQAFPSFGSERMGAPVMAFCRIDDKAIRLREPVLNPDAQLQAAGYFTNRGLHPGGYMLINSTRDFAELGIAEFVRGFHARRLCTVPATEVALKHVGRPLPNAALLGGFAALSQQIRLESLVSAIRDKFPRTVAEKNIAAATEAHALVKSSMEVAVA